MAHPHHHPTPGPLPARRRTHPLQEMRVFLIIWAGQLVSLIGSGLTGFALGVWVFQRTGSITQFALISLFAALPNVLLAPIAGALADRWNRRTAMLLSDSLAGLSTLAVALLLWAGRLETWHIYVATMVSAACSTLQWPAYSAATTLLVPKRHLARASGMVQMGQAAAQVISPVLAGALLTLVDIQGVILIDFATFLVALVTLLAIRIPAPPVTEAGTAGKGSLLREAAYGWSYIVARPGLLHLLVLMAVINFTMGIAVILFTPVVLSMSSPAVLGTVLSVSGLGAVAGGMAVSIWGGPQRRVWAILTLQALTGALLIVGGMRPWILLIAFAAFGCMFCHPFVLAASQAIWQSKVHPDVQGRVFAVRRMIAWSASPLAALAAGPLADAFEPLLLSGGALAGSAGRLIGVGPGRGIALLIMVVGLISMAAAAIASRSPRLVRLEEEIPDAIGDSPAAV